MNIEDVELKLKSIIKDLLDEEVIDKNKNLFDKFSSYELLYIVQPIEDFFNIKIKSIVSINDYKIMTIHNLAKKIVQVKNNDKSSTN